MSKKKATILNWSAGMTTSNRANSVEEFNSGFSLIENFDIYSDPNVIKPVGEFERWNTEQEEQYSFKGIGVLDTDILATGKSDSAWYGNFQYRVKVTPDFYDTQYLVVSLAHMPANFWTVMNTGATEIRITNKDGVFVPKDTIRFDAVANTGFLVFPVEATDEYFHVYYGDSEASEILDGTNSNVDRGAAYAGASMSPAFIFDTNTSGFPLDRSAFSPAQTMLNQGSIGEYEVGGTGFIGYGLKNGTYYNDNTPYINIPNDSVLSVGFTIKIGSSFGNGTLMIGTAGNYFDISVNNNGGVGLRYDNDVQPANTINTFPTTLSLNTVNRVVCTYEENVSVKIYINGILAASSTSNVDSALDDNDWYLNWTVAGEPVGDIMYFNRVYSNDRALHEYNMLFYNATYIEIATEESKPSYGQYETGCALYKKGLTDSTWKVYTSSIPLSSSAHTAVLAPILPFNKDNIIFFTEEIVTPGVLDIAYFSTESSDVVDFNTYLTSLSTSSPEGGTLQVAQLGVDDKYYVGNGTSAVNSYTETGVVVNAAFDTYPLVKGIEDRDGYIAIAGDYKDGDKSYLQLWDRAGTQAIQNVNIGPGEAQVLGNLKGTLFVVVNNFIDNSEKAVNTQSMDIRVYTGGGNMETTHRISVPTTMDGFYTNAWDKPVSQLKGYTKNAVLFYAKIPNESGYSEGLWALGKNEITGSIGLSLLYTTSELNHVYNIATVGNQVVLFHDDNKVSHLTTSPLYTKTSTIRTKVFNDGNSQRDKELSGVEIMHETLTGNQTIKVYKKNEVDTDWVYLFESTASNQESVMSKEITVDENGDALGNFKEIEFKLESTGGAAGITQFAMTYDTLNNTV